MKALKEFLKERLAEDEFKDFCHKHYRGVYNEFTTGMSKSQQVRILLDSVARKGLLDQLARQLKNDFPKSGIIASNFNPCQIPNLDKSFVKRSQEYEQLINLIVNHDKTKKHVIGLVGAGGIGKTTLATAACHDQKVKSKFPDNRILWLELGKDPSSVKQLQNLHRAILASEGPTDIKELKIALQQALENQVYLIGIDDVWRIEHLKNFLQLGSKCVYLFTTRDQKIPTQIKSATSLELDRMTDSESIQLLTSWLDEKPIDLEPLAELAKRLNNWPLFLDIAGKSLSWLIKSQKYVYTQAVTEYLNTPPKKIGTNLQPVIQTSLALLHSGNSDLESPDIENLFHKLAIFPNKTGIPLSTISVLWQQDIQITKELAHRLNDVSLIHFAPEKNSIRFQRDLIYQYLLDETDTKARKIYHDELLDGYNPNNDSWPQLIDSFPNEIEYLENHLLYHLEGAERLDEIHQLFDSSTKSWPHWAKIRIQTNDSSEDISGLLADIGQAKRVVDQEQSAITSILQHRIRYTLFVDVIKQAYRSVPIEALPSLFSIGLVPNTLLLPIMQDMEGDAKRQTEAYLNIVGITALNRD